MIRWIGDGGHAHAIKALLKGEQPELDVAFVAIGDNAARKREAEALGDVLFARLIFGQCFTDEVGDGTVIMPGAVVMPGAKIGKHCIINTNASVDHDCVLEDYVHVAPGANLCGNVRVGEGTLVGVGVGVAPGAEIPPWSVVKARRINVEPVQSHG